MEIASALKPLSLFLILFLFAVASLLPTVNAAQYSIPIYGPSWADRTITVTIDTNPTSAHDEVLEAMMIWNQAQVWFKETYLSNYPSLTSYQFKEVQSGGQVTVTFTKNPIQGEYGGLTTGTANAGYFQRATVEIYVVGSWTVKYVALHELGHVLGLDHVSSSYSEDLMYQSTRYYVLPSTLDLYGVIMIGTGRASSPIILPNEIAYTVPPSTAVPEFTAPVILILGVGLALMIVRRRSKLA